jgi:lipooligosaccharide transport system permease protein
MLPMFLFSATFYPISVYPEWIQRIIEVLPLWHGVELVRGLTTGALEPGMWLHLGYFVLLIAFGITLTTRRLRILFLA